VQRGTTAPAGTRHPDISPVHQTVNPWSKKKPGRLKLTQSASQEFYHTDTIQARNMWRYRELKGLYFFVSLKFSSIMLLSYSTLLKEAILLLLTFW
jgi:hypothetical protein